jgi:hypothetical protein
MSQPDAPNPEHRSSSAMLCFCLGAGFCIIAYVLGIGAVIGAVLAGNDPAVVVGSIFAALAIGLLGFGGFLMMLIGGVWMLARVIADQRGGEEKRYRDVER